MLNDKKNNPDRSVENNGQIESKEQMMDKSKKRLESERERYFDLYGIKNHIDKNNFDLIVDTNKNNLKQVVDIIVTEYKKWREKN
jgi:cytidylate kinase